MRIWIDGYEANVVQRLGSSQVAFELLRNLEKLDSDKIGVDKKNDYLILLPSPPLGDLPKERLGWKYKILKPKRLWTRFVLPLALYSAKQKPDLIFSPTHYIPRFSPVKRVAVIFDLAYLHFPEMFNQKDLWQLKNWTNFSLENADHILTISNFSKKDIIKQYSYSPEKITVVYPGYDKEIFKPINDQKKIQQVLKKHSIEYSYIIYIGTIQPRKNLLRLIEAFARIEGDLQLVIVGKTTGGEREGWKFKEILEAPDKLGVREKVKFLGFVATEELPYLLSGSLGFVLPSLWEGFGIPVLEAMACGTAVITSSVSSLPEVVGKAGMMVDPYSEDQIEQAIRTLVSDKKLRDKYSKVGLIQAQKFSWEKTTKTILKAFEQIGKSV